MALRFLFVFTDKRQRAVAGSACSSEKGSRISKLPTSPKCFLEHQLSFPGLTSSGPVGLYSLSLVAQLESISILINMCVYVCVCVFQE